MLAMITYPEVLAKAQAEIDTVVGTDRLPAFADRASLPYIECLLSECLRWAAPVPLGWLLFLALSLYASHSVYDTGLPHRLMEDDVYEGMFIPKGSLVSSPSRRRRMCMQLTHTMSSRRLLEISGTCQHEARKQKCEY